MGIRERLLRLQEQVAEAAVQSGRSPEDIQIMAVSKTVLPEHIQEAMQSGQVLFGENRVQELEEKQELWERPETQIHLIGHLQRNKAKKAVALTACIQSVDSYVVAQEIARAARSLGKTMPVLLEVNIGRDPRKQGMNPEDLLFALESIRKLRGLKICGLMTVPPIEAQEKKTLEHFFRMQALFEDMKAKKLENIELDVLSMGMSSDFLLAIQAGSTLVRIGSALFGSRV